MATMEPTMMTTKKMAIILSVSIPEISSFFALWFSLAPSQSIYTPPD